MTADLLKLIAPGTPIRDGLENILRAKTGALLLITDNNDVIKEVVDGGFYINEEYTSSKLYELAKMDGAIVLSGDLKRILFANAQLIPSREIETRETGTRHRTAERTGINGWIRKRRRTDYKRLYSFIKIFKEKEDTRKSDRRIIKNAI